MVADCAIILFLLVDIPIFLRGGLRLLAKVNTKVVRRDLFWSLNQKSLRRKQSNQSLNSKDDSRKTIGVRVNQFIVQKWWARRKWPEEIWKLIESKVIGAWKPQKTEANDYLASA